MRLKRAGVTQSGVPKNMTREQAIAKWVKALRSGRYRQAENCLQTTEEGKVKNCCLGVAERVIPGGFFEVDFDTDDAWIARRGGSGSCHIMTPQLAKFLGMSRDGKTKITDRSGSYVYLTEMNDQGFTFNQIADVIEAGLLKNENRK